MIPIKETLKANTDRPELEAQTSASMITEVCQSNEAMSTGSFEFQKNEAKSKQKSSFRRIFNKFDPKFISVSPDGCCLYRAILVEQTGNKRFAMNIDSESVKNTFLIKNGEIMRECIEEQLTILKPSAFGGMSNENIYKVVYKNLEKLYDAKLFYQCFEKKDSKEERKSERKELNVFADGVTGLLICRLNVKCIASNGYHYDVKLK